MEMKMRSDIYSEVDNQGFLCLMELIFPDFAYQFYQTAFVNGADLLAFNLGFFCEAGSGRKGGFERVHFLSLKMPLSKRV